MKKTIFLALSLLLLLACKNTDNKKNSTVSQETVSENGSSTDNKGSSTVSQELIPEKRLSKLEQLQALPKDSLITYYDLSNDSLRSFPDLSQYRIHSLNLSHNRLDTLIPANLPREIEKLDLSYNAFKGEFVLSSTLYSSRKNKRNPLATLKQLELSHNKIVKMFLFSPLSHLSASYNELNYISPLRPRQKMDFLDISNNPNLSNEVYFNPNDITVIYHHNIANQEKLKRIIPPPVPPHPIVD